LDGIRRSYTMTAGDQEGSELSSYSGMSGDNWSRKFSEAISASTTLLMTEVDNKENIYGKYQYADIDDPNDQIPYNGSISGSENFGLHERETRVFNYLFTDLHVETLFYLDTIDPTKKYIEPTKKNNGTAYGYFSVDPTDDPVH
jgi:hypothetical protein